MNKFYQIIAILMALAITSGCAGLVRYEQVTQMQTQNRKASAIRDAESAANAQGEVHCAKNLGGQALLGADASGRAVAITDYDSSRQPDRYRRYSGNRSQKRPLIEGYYNRVETTVNYGCGPVAERSGG